MFINSDNFGDFTWQSFERTICRLLLHRGFTGVRLVGQTSDKGADVLAHKHGKRWLVQVKHWKNKVGADVVDRTIEALGTYKAQIPVIASRSGFTEDVHRHQVALSRSGVPLQLWDRHTLLRHAENLPTEAPVSRIGFQLRGEYQEQAVQAILATFHDPDTNRAMVVLATGLGKTVVAAEVVRRLSLSRNVRVLAIAHTNELVYQLERSFWPFLGGSQETVVWNGLEHPHADAMERATMVFACLPTLASHVQHGTTPGKYDVVLIDECHHVGAQMYSSILEEMQAGSEQGPFLVGLTATPWRPDDVDLVEFFGEPIVSIDLVTGMKNGFLTNVDYRMYTDNIDWEGLANLAGSALSPRLINRSFFIHEWDDAVVYELQRAWGEQANPRAIVFCGTIDHALTMRDRINGLGFSSAAAIHSGMPTYERNKTLSDFHDGSISTVCAVDIFNEGVDVPDVNIIVFQRVTHSRRIFVQQLGRGLRISPGKTKVIVLDFVSDIRRFAAGIELKDELLSVAPAKGEKHVHLHQSVKFCRVGGEDQGTESFLREWLDDVATIESAGEDASLLKYPPLLPGSKR